jgi:hypothetical protein
MKTITQYGPMIFSQMAEQAEKRALLRRQLGTDVAAVLTYTALGLWLSFDTGFAPWHWQFWLMFTPLYIAGELATHGFKAK